MISRRRARETPRIYSSCIRTHTRILRINRCIYTYDVARDTTTLRRRRVLQFRSSPFSSLLFSFSFSFSLPFLFDSCTDPSRRPTIDEFVVDTDRPTNSTAIPRISSPSFLSTRHVLSLSLSSPSRPNHRRKNQRIFASSVSFYPIGTRVSVRAFVAYRPILPLSLLHLPSAHVPLRLSPAFLSLSLSLTASPPFRSSLDPVTSLLPCLRVLPESSPPETFFLSPLRIELRGRFDIIEWIFVKEP